MKRQIPAGPTPAGQAPAGQAPAEPGFGTRASAPEAGLPDASIPEAGQLISDGSIETFERDVLGASMTVPVIVNFGASWCGPCKQLAPMLEQGVQAAAGKVRLVKVDIDKNQMLASQLRVQSVPMVYAFFHGQPVDGFNGAVPQSELTAFIERLVQLSTDAGPEVGEGPDPAQVIIAAGEAFNQGDVATAAQLYGQLAQADPENVEALAGIARCYVASGEIEQARNVLATVPEDKKSDPAVSAIEASIELAQSAENAGDADTLASKVEGAPDDHQLRYDFAEALIGQGNMDAAIGQLLILMEKDREWNEAAARKKLLVIFGALGAGDPLVKSARRQMSSILFS